MLSIPFDSLGSDPLERYRALEAGNILYFPQSPIPIQAGDLATLLRSSQTGGSLHKNISYKPKEDKVSGLSANDRQTLEQARTSLRDFSRAAIECAGTLLPRYRARWRIDYASFRGIEEEGRDLPWKKRNDLLHTDAFPTRPTNGDLILRFFVNINPSKERVWVTSDPFPQFAPTHAGSIGLSEMAAQANSPLRPLKRLAHSLNLPVIDRSPYDRFMLELHDYLKSSESYQRDCPKYRFVFPPGSAWMVFTDVVPHSVLSGQYALEQTFLISKATLASPEISPAAILEKLAGVPLTR